jgi:hypothetical protein
LIGSREELLFAKGDRIINPSQGIVANMEPIAETVAFLGENKLEPNSIYCLYGETYGGKINGAKQYSGHGNYNLRLFDMWKMKLNALEELLEDDVDRISSWREHGGQPFVSVDKLMEFCCFYELSMVPYIRDTIGTDIPTGLQDTWDWLQEFKSSNAKIDNDGNGESEGVVVRYEDRSLIRKLRFEDYQRTKKFGLIK